jgi:hypothetical protein
LLQAQVAANAEEPAMRPATHNTGTNHDRLYRAKTISELGISLKDEIAWLNPTALKHLKNYQIWHHRHTIIDALGSAEGEPEFISTMLEQDSKNYHVWSYRQWLVKRFDLFDKPEELEWTAEMIEDDVRTTRLGTTATTSWPADATASRARLLQNVRLSTSSRCL